MQARLRKRGKDGVWTYTHTIRRPEINKQSVELRMNINVKDYEVRFGKINDPTHKIFVLNSIVKQRAFAVRIHKARPPIQLLHCLPISVGLNFLFPNFESKI